MTDVRLWKLLTGAEVILLLRKQGLSLIACEEDSPFSSWKLIFFYFTMRAASCFTLISRDHCSIQKSVHFLIISVLLSKTVVCHCFCYSPWGICCKRLNIFNCLWVDSAAPGRYPWFANSFSSSPALFPWTIKTTRWYQLLLIESSPHTCCQSKGENSVSYNQWSWAFESPELFCV